MKVLRECAWLLLLAAIPTALGFWLHPKRPPLSWSAPSTAEVLLSEIGRWASPPLWVDARQRTDYEKQHIPGAILLNEDAWNELVPGFLASWRPGMKVVVYCDSAKCDASKDVARRLERELNLPEIFVLKGGWSSWLQSKP